MQVLISSARPVAALFTKSGSAKNGRAIDTISASSLDSNSSAIAGLLIRLEAMIGMLTTFLMRATAKRHAALGTTYPIVGTRDSCHPIPVLRMSAPACSTAWASVKISFKGAPPSTKSMADIRYMMRKD